MMPALEAPRHCVSLPTLARSAPLTLTHRRTAQIPRPLGEFTQYVENCYTCPLRQRISGLSMSKLVPGWQRASVMEAVFDQLSDALVLYDNNSIITGVNEAAEILGISLKTLHNKLKEYGTGVGAGAS